MKSAGAQESEASEGDGVVAPPASGVRAIPMTGAANQIGIDGWQEYGGQAQQIAEQAR
jgi:hypothetical protein